MTDDKKQFIRELAKWLTDAAEDLGLDIQASLGEVELVKAALSEGKLQNPLRAIESAVSYGEALGGRSMIVRISERLIEELKAG